MAGRDETKTVGEPGKAQTGRKKMMNLRIGGPGILVGALAVAFVVGAAIRIRRYRSLQKAKKRLQCSSRDYSNGGLRSILQADRHCPRYSVDGTSEMIWDSEEEALEDSSELGQDNKSNDLSEYEIQIEKIGENEGDEASDTDHGEWKTTEISESSAEEEHSANEAEGEEKYDDAEDSFAGNEAEGENDVTDDEYEDKDEDEDEDEDDGECVVEKCEEGSQGTEESSMESNAEVVWPEEMKEWPLEIKEMKISHRKDRIAKSYNFLNETERRIPVKIKLKIWIWTTLMLLLLLLLSVTNQKSYVSLSY